MLSHETRIHTDRLDGVVHAELSLTFASFEALDKVLNDLGLSLFEIPKPGLFLAGKAFMLYRKKGGMKTNVLADFFIGAQAAVLKCPILTRDDKRYRAYFPRVPLITPESM